MKIQRQLNSNKKILATILILLVVLLSAGAVYAYQTNLKEGNDINSSKEDTSESLKPNDVDLNPATDEQKGAGADAKTETIAPPKTVPTDTLSLSISVANYYPDENIVRLRVLIDDIIAGGTCTLLLEKGTQSHSYNATTQTQASNSTCKGFDVPADTLSQGDWNATITVTASDKTGSAKAKIQI